MILESKINHTIYCDANGVYKTYLMKAVESKDLEFVKWICAQEGLDINFQNNEQETALSYSLLPNNYNPKIVEHLLRFGADPNIHPSNEPNVVRALDNLECLRGLWLLIDYGANINKPFVPNPLGICIMDSRLDVAFSLLHCGANPNIPNQYGINALGNAACSEYSELFPALLMHGANPLYLQGNNENILMLAAQNGSYNVLRTVLALIEAEYKEYLYPMLHHIDEDGKNVLMHAIQSGSYRKVNLLIHYGVDVNQRLPNGCVPLRYAMRYVNIKVVKALLNSGALLNKKYIIYIENKKNQKLQPIIDECKKYFQKTNEKSTIEQLEKIREILVECGFPFDIAIDISQKSMEDIYMSDHIKKIDIKRAIALYNRNRKS